MTEYEDILKARSDMTEWLVHFTRADSERNLSARERLRNILVDGVLRPGWSERGPLNRRTIYGGLPVVCFTEQPLAALTQTLSARNPRFVSGYGILVHKRDVFADGGRPVIYGMESVSEAEEGDVEYKQGFRMLRGLNPLEQFRYSVFAPSGSPPIDWSHEREWRWPQGSNEPGDPDPSKVGTFRLAGSGWHASSTGKSKGRVAVFVESDDDIPWLVAEMKRLAAPPPTERDPCPESRWLKHIRESVGVVSLQRVRAETARHSLEYGRLETWPPDDMIQVLCASTAKRAAEIFGR